MRPAIERALRAVPPLWPLTASVAVNPFLGQAEEDLPAAAARLARVAGVPVTAARRWYQERIETGAITEADLAGALAAAPARARPTSLAALKAAAWRDAQHPAALPTIAELAARASCIDWPGIVASRLGAWAADHFDEGQALWTPARERSAYAAWRAVATHDLTPEILGLAGFARHVAEAPESAEGAIARAVHRLRLQEAALETYAHRLLMTLGGWAQLARFRLWQAELAGGTDGTLLDLLAARLVWEEALFLRHEPAIKADWARVRAAHAAPLAPTQEQAVDAILQEAAERAAQRGLAMTLATPAPPPATSRPLLQAAFCIDVRSEVFRRALEALHPRIRTLGFAGFFGLAVSHRRFASDMEEARAPVLLRPGLHSHAGGAGPADRRARIAARARRAWGRFRMAAVSSFAFVEAAGPLYAGKLLADGLALHRALAAAEPAPRLDPEPDTAARIAAAETVLRAMSLTREFAPVVLLLGHGALVANNPHASALQCGACGGHPGEVNARLLAALLNEEPVRRGLRGRGIDVPEDTLFVAGLHDTVTDTIRLQEGDHPSPRHLAALREVRSWLAAAGRAARAERARRLPRAGSGRGLARRGRDWAETRPEWGLAGCAAFIAAPRHRTAGRDLGGRAFLHDYAWADDAGFRVLELILTAPVVVASWISLQYYGSVVAPEVFGAGNKLLHNVVSGVGVLEGNGGALRGGLPWQSVHDGERPMHEPLRLSVCVEAPCEAISEILGRHAGVRALFDRRWLHLFALDGEGRMAWRYVGGLEWQAMDASGEAAPASALALAG